MLNVERETQIINILNERRSVTVEYLCRNLYISEATVRRDLTRMEEAGVLRRVRGGAVLIGGRHKEAPLFMRNDRNVDKKETIARLALPFAKQATTMFMDASSTVCELARICTDFHDVSIMTNGLNTMNILTEKSGIEVYSTGGRIINSSLHGNTTVESVNSVFTDVVFFSCCGLSIEQGITEASENSVAVKKNMLKHAKKKILLCDSSKLDMSFFCHVCFINDVDVLITDKKPDAEFMEKAEIEIIYPNK